MEEADEPYFAFSATLRIHGKALDLSEITRSMGLVPTHTHKKGEPRGPGGYAYSDDAWHYSAELPERRRRMLTYKSFGRMWPQRVTSC